MPSTHTLWIFWGLAGWELRLRPLRFFYFQAQSDEPSDLRGSLSPTTRHHCAQHVLVYAAPLYKHIFIKQLKQIQKSNTRFRSLSGDMMTGFVQAAVVGPGVEGAQRSVV